ncbi:MAG: phenylalanine--tRNA ligase subunit beta [Bacteroidales bacterium]|jgi:phenylalanyl-tRNA synthetase beta chain
MKISYNWLKEYVSWIPSQARVAEILTGCGLEVEGMETWFSIKGGLKGVVIGQVLTCVRHPDSDHLSLTTVDVGLQEPLKIVCGASNVVAGQKVVVATVGTTLFFNDKEITIQRAKIRGELSEGMICAEDELGIGTSHSGIMVLDSEVILGTPAKDYFKVEEDTIFEIGLTPNRSDATSHFGIARDLIAVMNCMPGNDNEANASLRYPVTESINTTKKEQKFTIIIEDYEACPRYSGLAFWGITVKESPTWLKNRLNAVGLRPINNIVDITNFILLELGQPLHAFDADMIKGDKVIIKKFPDSKKFITLDQVEREITNQDLMICNSEEPMCIAGVFGGLNTGVSANTSSVFLESAYFDPRSIRKTAKYHGLQTDASFRFERGADINITVYALQRAASLISELAGGENISGIIDAYPQPRKPINVFLSYNHLDRLIGKVLERDKIKKILISLGVTILSSSDEGLSLEIASYKVDVTREADVIEEILRIYGYNNIEFSSVLHSSISYSPKPDPEKIKNGISDYLCSNGFSEIMNNSLTRSAYYEKNPVFPIERNVKILNPLSKDMDVLRQSLLYGGLESLVYNQNRKISDCKLFELGNCYFLKNEKDHNSQLNKYDEQNHLSIFLTGRIQPENWNVLSRKADIYDLKGFIDNILLHCRLSVSNFQMVTNNSGIFSQGIDYMMDDVKFVTLGSLSQSILKNMDLRQEVFYADLNWTIILSKIDAMDRSIVELSKFPEVRRDLALEVDQSVTYAQIKNLAFITEKKLLKEVGLFDVYEGEKIEPGKKSYAVSFILRDDQKTLTDTEIDKTMNRLIKAYSEKLSARVR